MATVLELAYHADVSAETVLRVLNGEAVSVDVATRVRTAIDELGAPPYLVNGSGRAIAPASSNGTPAQPALDTQVISAELQPALPQEVGSVVYEALRVEVRPVAEHMAAMGTLVERLIDRLEGVGQELHRERGERLDDIALLVELVTSGWRNVDQRLGRLEKLLLRQEAQARRPAGNGSRFEARIVPPPEQPASEG